MSKRFLLVLAAIGLIFFGLIFFSKREARQPSNGDNGTTSSGLSQNIYGKKDSPVSLVEFGDFQCPACLGYFPIVQQIKAQYGDRISIQFRHYPLSEIHQNAVISARASEAAAMQGKFWEMHDKLYENQNAWGTSQTPNTFFESYAQEIGLDVEKFKTDIKSTATNDIVQADRAEARKQGHSSTPTFVLNGKTIENPPRTIEEFGALIEEALKAANTQ